MEDGASAPTSKEPAGPNLNYATATLTQRLDPQDCELQARRDASQVEIAVPAHQRRVSRRHLRITPEGGDRYIIEDLGTSGGTQVTRNGHWERIRQATVTADDPISLTGEHTTVRQLLSQLRTWFGSPKRASA